MPTTTNNPSGKSTSLYDQAKQPCYISTPAHVSSYIGRFMYIYTGAMGSLELTPKSLVFTYRNGISMEIGLDTVVKLDRGSYSRWAKPFRLDFIAVTYARGHDQHTVYFTPTRSAFTSTWETNKVITQWMDLLQRAVNV